MVDFSGTTDGGGVIQLPPQHDSSAVWTIPLLCVAIAVIACCVLVPAAQDNRSLAIENMHLQADLAQINKQIAINGQFLNNVSDNPTLLERLAERQMKLVHNGESVLKLDASQPATAQMSPFLLLNLPPPAMAIASPSPRSQLITQLAGQPRIRLFAIGGALLLMATALVLGAAPRPPQN